jgi:AraC family transcriptional activator of pobA
LDLSQFIVVAAGGGTFELEGTWHEFRAPWLAWIPSGVVHGFEFRVGTAGLVLTVSADIVRSAVNGVADGERLAALTTEPCHAPLLSSREIGVDVVAIMEAIEREHELPRTGVNSVISANLMLILVAMLRLRTLVSLDRHLGKVQASEFRRFREFVEHYFHEQHPIAEIARRLGITQHRLRAISVRAVGKGPLAVQHDRIMVECKRELMFTGKPIAEIAFDCGFQDPAHFSRFFSVRAGCSPREYRRQFRVRPEKS